MARSRAICTNTRRPGFATFVAVAAALLLSTATLRAAEPKKGGSVSVSMESDLPTLDPLGFASFNDRNAGLLLYDTLLDIDAKGNVIPNIAERIDASEDVMSFKLTLRNGVKFSDGTAYDAAAVVKNFQRIMDPKNRCRCVSDLSTIASLEATGPLEVMIKMKSPSAHFPAALADVAGMVASPAAVEKYGADFGNYGVGAGPFKLKEWRRGAQVIFERNPDYWRKPAYLDEVVLRPMPDEQTRYASLKAGNLDIVTNAAARDRVDAEQGKKFQILNPGSLATSFIQINMGSPDVSDIRVRQALALALDRVALNRALNRGLYKIANTPFGTGLFPHEQVDGYPGFDPAKAKKLVEEYGKPVKIKLSINASPVNALGGQALQQMWKKVGIETEIVPYEQVQLVRMAASRDYQVMLYRWAGGADPDKNVHQFFHSKGTVNRVNFNNPEMDKLLDAGRATTNQAERMKIYRQINNLLAKELPYLFLWYFDNVALANPAVKGVTPIPDGLLRMHSAWLAK
jgi:peptide/nickel transport system substrate-binding protein